MPEQIDPRPPERLEKPFHRVGRKHRCRLALNGPSVALIFFETVKGDQMAASAIQQEAEELLEDLTNRLALGGLADGAEGAAPGADTERFHADTAQTDSSHRGLSKCYW